MRFGPLSVRRPLLPVAALALALTACSAPSSTASSTSSPAAAPASARATAAPTLEPTDLPALVRRIEPSVVTVLVNNGLGSGVVYRADGMIITNQHVVGDAPRVMIAFADGQRLPADVLATDPIVDLAVVKVDRTGLPVPDYRTQLPAVGEQAVVVGSPLGFQGTVTAGIISGLHRDIPGSAAMGSQSLVDLIQTDAAISPGNSGGAVIDAAGRVVGLSEAYIPPSAGAVSLGFAIPAATVVQTADELLANGRAQHAYLGVQFGQLTPEIAQQLGVDRPGALVLGVGAGGPAAQAGIQPGDVIVQVAGMDVSSTEDVLGALRDVAPGDQLQVTVQRGGQPRQLTVTVADRPR